MNRVNRNNILKIYAEQLDLYKIHLIILRIMAIITGIILSVNIINGLKDKINLFDIYNNPLLYYAVFILGIIILKLLSLYNFKKVGIYLVYIINGSIQIIITIWFLVAFVVSFLANILITFFVLSVFICISVIDVRLILYYHKIRNIFIY